MVELCLQGLTRSDIARLTDRSPEGVGLIINSPLFQAELVRRRAQQNRSTDEAVAVDAAKVSDILNRGAEQAANKMVELLRHNDPKIALGSAKDILDRTYGTKAKEAGTSSGVVVLNAERIEILLSTMREAHQVQSRVIQTGLKPVSATETEAA